MCMSVCLSVSGIILFIHENSVSLLFQLNPKVGLNIKFTLKQTGLFLKKKIKCTERDINKKKDIDRHLIKFTLDEKS